MHHPTYPSARNPSLPTSNPSPREGSKPSSIRVFPEEDQGDLPPERAKAEAEALGMRYLNIPVSPVEFSPASLAGVSRALL